MDAHLFRRVCDLLLPRLAGARLEKIQAPAPDLLCLSFRTQQHKLHLLVKYGRRDSFLCSVKERPAALAPPSAQVMGLRRQAQGRRVRFCVAHWPQRRLDLLFSGAPEEGAPPCRLCLDLRSGPRLEEQEGTEVFVRWPSPEELPRALKEWHAWPALTPALRRTLPLLDGLEQQALLADLAAGGGDLFVYGRDADTEVVAWPLPDALRKGREERVFEDILEAASLAGTARIFGALAAAEKAARERQERREMQRLRRLLDKLGEEETRLRALAEKQREGLALQAQLWRYPSGFRSGEMILDTPDGPLRICPDPRHSLREHMERLFHDAGRGRRGLARVEQRRAEFSARLAQAGNAPEQGKAQDTATGNSLSPAHDRSPGFLREACQKSAWPANVQAFASSDGIVILRGRDAAGNLALLRLANPYDLWMHAEGGPGAHVLVRRGQGQELPRRSMEEAAQLALAKSRWRGSAAASVICAQARHVRPVRGGKPGSARVDKVECTLELQLDPDIEMRVTRL